MAEEISKIEKEAIRVILDILYQTCFWKEEGDCYVFDSMCVSSYENAYKFLKNIGFVTKDSNNRIFKVPKEKAKEVGFD